MTRWLRENGYHTRRAGIRAQRRLLDRGLHAAGGAARAASREAAGERVAIIGQSRGGIFARVLAVRRPDLVSGIVTLGSPTVQPAQRAPGRARPGRARRRARHRPRARHVPHELPARRLLRALPRGPRGRRSRPRSASPRCTRAPTGSSTGTPAWTRRREQIEVRASHIGMGANAEVYAEVGHALGDFGQPWANAA